MPITQAELDWAVKAFAAKVDDYSRARNYYAGNHDLAFATPKFQTTFGTLFKTLAYNRCRSVVDAMANRLKVTGFQVNGVDLSNLTIGDAEGTDETENPENDLGGQALSLWRLGKMDLREGEIYVEAGVTGDAYGVVWFDAEPPFGTGLPRIYPNKAEIMRVRYDDDGRINLAAKSWRVESGPDMNKRRITFYTPLEIIRLITTQTAEAELPKELANYTLYREINGLGQPVQNPIAHDLGRPPVVHYANNAPMVGDYGLSELKDVMPLQDALNKAVADMLVAMEYNAFPQRWAIGIEPEPPDTDGKRKLPWRPGPGEVWYSTNKEARFGSFEVSALDQYLKVQDQFDLDIARVSGTPVHWLLMSGNFPSGESLKTAESPFTAKLSDRQRSHGAGHAEAMALKFNLLGLRDPLLIETQWESAEPRSKREQVEIGKMMADAGMPLEIVAKAMGLDDQDILTITAAAEEERASQERALASMNAAMVSQNGAEPPETE